MMRSSNKVTGQVGKLYAQHTYQPGQFLLAVGLLGLGITTLIIVKPAAEFILLSSQSPIAPFVAITTGIIMTLGGFCLLINRLVMYAAMANAILFMFLLVYPNLVTLITDIYHPGKWVAFQETLAFSAACMLIMSFCWTTYSFRKLGKPQLIRRIAEIMFAIAIFLFGIQHILYEKFIISLMPSWLPARLFWAHIVKAAFIGTAISLVLNVLVSLSTLLLGIMFLLWVLIIHIPLTIKDSFNEREWISLFIAIFMCGISFYISQSRRRRNVSSGS